MSVTQRQYGEAKHRLVIGELLMAIFPPQSSGLAGPEPSQQVMNRIWIYLDGLSMWQILAKLAVTYQIRPLEHHSLELRAIVVQAGDAATTTEKISGSPETTSSEMEEEADRLFEDAMASRTQLSDDDPDLQRRLAELFTDVPVKPILKMVESEDSDRERYSRNGVGLVELMHFLMVECHAPVYDRSRWELMKNAAADFDARLLAKLP